MYLFNSFNFVENMESSRFVYLKSNFDPEMALALGKSVNTTETKIEHDSFFFFFLSKVSSYLSKRFFKVKQRTIFA